MTKRVPPGVTTSAPGGAMGTQRFTTASGAVSSAPRWHPAEPPAGLGRANLHSRQRPDQHRSRTVTWAWRGPYPERRWALLILIALVGLAALGTGGGILIARQYGSQTVRAGALSYRVPASWTVNPAPGPAALGVALAGVATGPRYSCGGQARARATVGSTVLARKDGVDARVEDAARDFGPLFATSIYGPGSVITSDPPAPVTVGTLAGATSLVSVDAPTAAGCPGLRGQVRVLALPSHRVGPSGGRAVLLLVVQRDTSGGPEQPGPVSELTVARILRDVQVTER